MASNFCPKCGAPCNPDNVFCANCGAVINNPVQQAPVNNYVRQAPVGNPQNNYTNNGNQGYVNPNAQVVYNGKANTENKEKGKGLTAIIIALSVILVILVAVLAVFLLKGKSNNSDKLNSGSKTTQEQAVDDEEDDEEETETTTSEPETVIVTVPVAAPTTKYVPPPKNMVSDAYYKVTTNHSSLNMRSGAGTNYSVVASVPKGAIVYVSTIQGSWAYIYYNGYSGWVANGYLTFYSWY